jgi:hypothetical protein
MTINARDLIDAIRHLAPQAEFSFQDGDLSTLKWDSPQIAQPTKAQIFAAVPTVQAQKLADQQVKEATKAALLERLGITSDEAKLLLS